MKKSSPKKRLSKLLSLAVTLYAVHDFVKNSMKDKKQVIVDGVSNFKGGFAEVIRDKQMYLTMLAMPVNNLLKDLAQIENEFKEELKKNGDFKICLNGKMVDAKEVLAMPMEENY
jgi:hypothetical protein